MSVDAGRAPEPADGEPGPAVLQFASLVPPARFGGAEKVVGWLTGELERSGIRVHNAGLKPRTAGPAEPGTPIRNLYWPFDGPHRGLARRTAWHAVDTLALPARRSVEELVRRVRPSAMVTHNLRGWGFAPWVVAGELDLPLVHVVHDYGLICNSSTLWRGEVCARVCGPCRPRRDATLRRWPGGAVVGVSAAVVGEHRARGVDSWPDVLVSHPTAAAEGTVGPVPARGDGVPATVGYLGRLSDDKGLAVLVEAVRGTGQRLLVAGQGDDAYVAELKARAPHDVEWSGWVDPARFFERLDLLVVPSVWLEPFGLVVVEAAAAGLPVLISDRPGLVEAARTSGARYATFAPNDVGALRAALGRSTAGYVRRPPATRPVDLVALIAGLAADTAARGR